MTTQNTTPEKEKKEYKTFRFIEYKVYQESKKWFQEILSLKGILDSYPELWYQLKNNSTSLVMNIAAASTMLPNEARRYLGNSITAANKAVACLDIACDMQAITPEEFKIFSEGFKGVIIQLKSFIKAMGTRKYPKPSADEQGAEKETVDKLVSSERGAAEPVAA